MFSRFKYINRCVFALTNTHGYLYGFKQINDIREFILGETETEEYIINKNGTEDLIFKTEHWVTTREAGETHHRQEVGFFNLYDMDDVRGIIEKRKNELMIENQLPANDLQTHESLKSLINDADILKNNFNYFSQEHLNLPIKMNQEIQNPFDIETNFDLKGNIHQIHNDNSNFISNNENF
ncbi:hypothetical protein M0813_01073 [Anaeramoeba flamelloides]|uniref:Uncharacterized protein n=1 Tax=Anaeramoeba flamelloides TaxID=1746091 RepID=A0ABQ8X0Y6_9EUKA|nr:hypothetical protein M0813_01073 [Anaeramoeba flamelloides]